MQDALPDRNYWGIQFNSVHHVLRQFRCILTKYLTYKNLKEEKKKKKPINPEAGSVQRLEIRLLDDSTC